LNILVTAYDLYASIILFVSYPEVNKSEPGVNVQFSKIVPSLWYHTKWFLWTRPAVANLIHLEGQI
jgi:hypothetical protein